MGLRVNWRNIAGPILVASIIGISATSVRAATLFPLQTGADLQAVCATPKDVANISDEDKERLQICGAYIQGFLGHYSLVRQQIEKPAFCLGTKGVSAEAVRQRFLELLGQRPQFRDLPISVDLASSIAWAFPCQKKAQKQG